MIDVDALIRGEAAVLPCGTILKITSISKCGICLRATDSHGFVTVDLDTDTPFANATQHTLLNVYIAHKTFSALGRLFSEIGRRDMCDMFNSRFTATQEVTE